MSPALSPAAADDLLNGTFWPGARLIELLSVVLNNVLNNVLNDASLTTRLIPISY
jgi:hypothetical protein